MNIELLQRIISRELQTSFLLSGNLRLASNDPLAKPIIWGNYLSDPMDMAILVEGVEIALSLANTSAMAKYNMTLNINPLPACSGYTPLSKDYWACAVRQDTGPENHQAGSCKMGPPHDPMAVVDHRLRVYGIRNLRVADASVMPQVNIFRIIILDYDLYAISRKLTF